MSKHMIIWYEGDLDSIEVFLNEPTVVVTAKRSDLETLKTLEEARNAGVYVLINDSNMRYVGQASGSVYSRLSNHDKNKLWWDTVIFFGRVDGQLDKSQLDYLENKLIRLFEEKGFTMDNQTAGNQSFIAPYQRGKAESLLSDALNILEHTAKLNIFKLARVKKAITNTKASSSGGSTVVVTAASRVGDNVVTLESSGSSVDTAAKEFVVSDDSGRSFARKSRRAAYRAYYHDLMKDDSYFKLLKATLPRSNSRLAVLEDSEIVIRRPKEFELVRDGVYFCFNLSAASIERNLEELGELLELKIRLKLLDFKQ